MADPTYEEVLHTQRGGSRGEYGILLSRMKPGEVREFESARPGTKPNKMRTGVQKAAARNGIEIATSIIDGRLWVARLREEDRRQPPAPTPFELRRAT